jgi:hypothetical protein
MVPLPNIPARLINKAKHSLFSIFFSPIPALLSTVPPYLVPSALGSFSSLPTVSSRFLCSTLRTFFICSHSFSHIPYQYLFSLSYMLIPSLPSAASPPHHFPLKHTLVATSLCSILSSPLPSKAYPRRHFPLQHPLLTTSL